MVEIDVSSKETDLVTFKKTVVKIGWGFHNISKRSDDDDTKEKDL